ncbi:Major Facilitator Superfamily transporter [Frankia sp. EI5c]|uniref:MFS transporter n=1 Tax=Frankia sp. EI5c TaxID=683316 RepID=UPI0007C28A3D|nr:MFS transporter [Frankia sp. EI5c]OAA27724.1 Major Facilitator Superfamily transporter [Frankia sp. EI5c]
MSATTAAPARPITATSAGSGGDGPAGRKVIVPIGLAAFITALDNTVVNVALPSMQRDFALSAAGLEWVATSYILAFSSLLLLGGRLTDLFGRWRIFQLGLVVFAVFSAVAGAADTSTELILARLAQGAGGALALPAALAVLAADLEDRDRHLGAGVLTAAIAAALALGPAVGGTITQYLHWSWIFYLNVPVCAVGILLVPRRSGGRRGRSRRARRCGPARSPRSGPAPRSRRSRRSRRADPATGRPRLDLPGVVLSALALLALTYALVEGNTLGWTSPRIQLAFATAAVAGGVFLAVERGSRDPMVDLGLFRVRAFSGGIVAQVLWGLGVNGVFFFTALFLQLVLGYSPTRAGLAFVPLALALIVMVPVAGALAQRCGAHWTVAGGLLLVAGGLLLTARIPIDATFVELLPGLLVIGGGSALTTPMTSRILEVLPPPNAGTASAVLSSAREVSGVLGVALTGAILLARQRTLMLDGASFPAAFVAGYTRGLEISAALVAVGAVVSLLTLRTVPRHRRRAGAHQARRQPRRRAAAHQAPRGRRIGPGGAARQVGQAPGTS